MITVEIEVPMMGKQYDFRIDEDVPLCGVKTEITEMICQKEQCTVLGNVERLLMWNAQNHMQLMQDRSAQENGLRTGSRILLV